MLSVAVRVDLGYRTEEKLRYEEGRGLVTLGAQCEEEAARARSKTRSEEWAARENVENGRLVGRVKRLIQTVSLEI